MIAGLGRRFRQSSGAAQIAYFHAGFVFRFVVRSTRFPALTPQPARGGSVPPSTPHVPRPIRNCPTSSVRSPTSREPRRTRALTRHYVIV
jgi:hypothetical protein